MLFVMSEEMSSQEKSHPSAFMTSVLEDGAEPSALKSNDTADPSTAIGEIDQDTGIVENLMKYDENPESTENDHNKRFRRAALRTLMMVKTSRAAYSAEMISIYFHEDRKSQLPRTLKADAMLSSILNSTTFSSDVTKRRLNYLLFKSPVFKSIICDMFWYVIAITFQVTTCLSTTSPL